MSELRFDDRVAVITGGGRGLGRAHALLLASRGCKVVVNDPGVSMAGDATDEAPADALVAEIRALGGTAVASSESVASPVGGKAIVEAAMDSWGRIDILIHSAGNVRKKTILDLTYDDFEAILDVHLRGAFHVAKPALAHMSAAGYGRMVFTSVDQRTLRQERSRALFDRQGRADRAVAFDRHRRRAHGVASNVIVPAAVTRMSANVDTSQFPPMEPDMVAPAVAYLCHESCMLSGEMLVAMGGRIARAWVAESPGVYRPDWTIEQVAADLAAIRDTSAPVIFPPVPDGQLDHLLYGFAMARKG